MNAPGFRNLKFIALFTVILFFTISILQYIKNISDNDIITDFHMHLLSDELTKEVKHYIGSADPTISSLGEKCDADTIISQMDNAGVQKALVYSGAYLWSGKLPGKEAPMLDDSLQYDKVKLENDWAAAQAAKYPDRLIPIFSINPLKDYAIDEIDRCVDRLGMTAMKLHLGSSLVNINDYNQLKRLNEVLSHAEGKNIPVIIHVWTAFSRPQDARIIVDKILTKHPKLRVCIAHLGYIGEPEMKVMEAIAAACKEDDNINKENIFFDMSAVIWTEDTSNILPETSKETLDKMTALIKSWGPDQVLWGSDFFAREPKEFLDATLTHLDLDEEDMKELLYKKPEDFLLKK